MEEKLTSKHPRAIKLSKKFHFDAAHKLPEYKGKCSRLHGHRWEFEVILQGNVNNSTGMLVDFKEVSAVVDELILEPLDHHNLNSILYNPTAENIIWWIFQKLYLKYHGDEGAALFRIRLWESSESYVELTKHQYEEWLEND